MLFLTVSRPSKFKDRNGYCGIGFKPSSNPLAQNNRLGIDLQSVVSMEILESDNGFAEAKNEEVQTKNVFLTF